MDCASVVFRRTVDGAAAAAVVPVIAFSWLNPRFFFAVGVGCRATLYNHQMAPRVGDGSCRCQIQYTSFLGRVS